ncbi:hypothetical protein [Streptomyces sp. ODS28]|uniref:hypothetical protein n=1 Tax=Streptomyces sp. ODS28 TaxID=3136688 RepID=UPI0031E9EC54
MAQLEGYLLWNAEVAEAHRQARDFADRLPWLTSTQREEVERVYADDRITVSRGVLTRIAGRAGELRSEYSAAYRQLRLRCALSLGLTGTALLSFALTLVVLARRG